MELLCLTAHEINNSAKAEYPAPAWAGKAGKASSDDIITAVTLTVDGRPWVERRHGPLHTHVRSFLPFHPITKVSPIREPRGVALWRQIIRDDFILITFCLIFFYRRGATLHWLGNIPQVGGGVRGTQIGGCLFFFFFCTIGGKT